MLRSLAYQLLAALRRGNLDPLFCKYYVVIRNCVDVFPAAYCMTFDEARQRMNYVVENCIVDGYSIVARNEVNVTLMKHVSAIDLFLQLDIGIEQAPPITRLDDGMGGFSSN